MLSTQMTDNMSVNENEWQVEVRTDDIPFIGVWKGWHIVVPCPDHCADWGSNCIWVHSTMRDEPVRLLFYEVLEKRMIKKIM